MSSVLFLAHRLPYPPNKGDKIRSFHLLEALRSRHRVHVGAFIDDADDDVAAREFATRVESAYLPRLRPLWRRAVSARGFLTGRALTDEYYAHAGMRDWVADAVRRHSPSAIVAFSSAMAQFVPAAVAGRVRVVVDFCDIDSDKWRQYAATHRGPLAAVYAREARTLEQREVEIAATADASLLVSEREAAAFRRLAAPSAARIHAVRNGVDAEYFDPARVASGRGEGPSVVFTGAMDYWANVQGVTWFARDIWPAIAAVRPDARFLVVGARPAPQVQALAQLPGVTVTGSVPDVRPFLARAHVVVAPLRIARGVQNKVLEAMAMERHVVATSMALQGLDAPPPVDVEAIDEPARFADRVLARLRADRPPVSRDNRAYVRRYYDWQANLAAFLELVAPVQRSAA